MGMKSGELVVAGYRLIKYVDKVLCEHLAEVDGSLIKQDDVALAGVVRVWGLKGSPDGSGRPAGAGLALSPADELIKIYQEIAYMAAYGSPRLLGAAIHKLHEYATRGTR